MYFNYAINISTGDPVAIRAEFETADWMFVAFVSVNANLSAYVPKIDGSVEAPRCKHLAKKTEIHALDRGLVSVHCSAQLRVLQIPHFELAQL